MHILWLKSDLLVPLDKGGKLRTWHLMRHLARRHEITYLSFADSSVRRQDLVEMGHVASRIVTVRREEAPKGSLKFYTGVARHVIDSAALCNREGTGPRPTDRLSSSCSTNSRSI